MAFRFELKVDYSSWPTWYDDGLRFGDFDPAQLPIRQETLQRLLRWQEVYDNTYEDEYPYNSSFPSEEALKIWVREGLRLWVQLNKELSSEYEVIKQLLYQGEVQPFTLETLPDELQQKFKQDIENSSESLL